MNAPRPEIDQRRGQEDARSFFTAHIFGGHGQAQMTQQVADGAAEAFTTMFQLLAAEAADRPGRPIKLNLCVTLDFGALTASVVAKSKHGVKPPVWKVHAYLCGKHTGFFEHPDREAAQADIDARTKAYGVLGCSYRMEEPNTEASNAAVRDAEDQS